MRVSRRISRHDHLAGAQWRLPTLSPHSPQRLAPAPRLRVNPRPGSKARLQYVEPCPHAAGNASPLWLGGRSPPVWPHPRIVTANRRQCSRPRRFESRSNSVKRARQRWFGAHFGATGKLGRARDARSVWGQRPPRRIVGNQTKPRRRQCRRQYRLRRHHTFRAARRDSSEALETSADGPPARRVGEPARRCTVGAMPRLLDG